MYRSSENFVLKFVMCKILGVKIFVLLGKPQKFKTHSMIYLVC